MLNGNDECVPWEDTHHSVTLLAGMKKRVKHVQPLRGPERAFGEAFRRFRKQKGVSQEKLCERADCDRTTVSMIERGVVSAKLETIVKLCKAISTPPSDVMRTMERSSFYL
jgi:DNA-binding XRE family transcriptional regulator